MATIRINVDSSGADSGTRRVNNALRGTQQQASQAGRATRQLERGFGRLSKVAVGLGAAIAAAFSVRKIQQFARASVLEFADLERSQFRLTKQIELMGAQSWITADEIEGMATRIDKATLESASNVRQAASVLMTAQDMTRESFERTMAVAVDMGEVLGLGLPTSVRYLVRAIGDTTGAMSMFRRYGIELEQSVQDQIEALQEAGRESEAYGLLLSNLESRFEGAAEAAGVGLAGSLDDLSRAGRQLREAVGQELAPTVKRITDDMTAWLDVNQNFLAQDVAGHITSIGQAAFWTGKKLKEAADQMKMTGEFWARAIYGEADPITRARDEVAALEKREEELQNHLHALEGYGGWGEKALMRALGLSPEGVRKDLADVTLELDNYRKVLQDIYRTPAPATEAPVLPGKMFTDTMPSAPTSAAMLQPPEFFTADLPPMIEPMEELTEDYINVVRELGNVGKSWHDQEIERIEEQALRWELMYGDRVDTAQWSASKILEIEQQANEQRLQMYQSAASMISGTFLQIAQAGGKHSTEAFRVYQASAIVQAGIAGALAYTQALGDPTVPATSAKMAMANLVAGLAGIQIGMIAAAQPPSYDVGGISRARGIYQTGDIQEAHVPVPSGKIPVELSGAGRQVTNNMVFNIQAPEGRLDQRSMRQLRADTGRAVNRAMQEA